MASLEQKLKSWEAESILTNEKKAKINVIHNAMQQQIAQLMKKLE